MAKYTFKRKFYEVVILENGEEIVMCVNPDIAERIARLLEKDDERLRKLKEK